MELSEGVGDILCSQRPIGNNNLQSRTQVLELGRRDVGDVEVVRSCDGIVDGLGADVDR